ncbi:AAA+-type ATPase, SpoVK/Ycf46/Vps4 family [Geosmithia morbida]|uniref:AAA+-type ATPase, SpoVK/Ycf46/Vps4 family n=1 Tax=Geosmithia morbida TaxID=1094350 RepID=A0A9P4YT59_9HYPO|nr:AAA+-type ATPase, SpoVK/Ycf46/Vps4 family [Geosmithia morbida]KAF4121196.1 AAA+-type ATPase, SpoVK/Ycf46/Vps4 family [Geosmithia morbida]
MASKRKRQLEVFDPNKSDSEDENFDPRVDRPRKSSKKARPSRRSKPGRKRVGRYRGSDIEDDDDELSDSQADSLADDDGDEDDEDDEDVPVNAAGRRTRKAATQQQNYRESSEDASEDVEKAEDEDDDDVPEPPQLRKIVKLKVPKGLPEGGRRATRATTEDADDFVELSNSGRHAVALRNSRSKSPDTALRRTSRAMKGVKKAPDAIEEATQESSAKELNDADEIDELANDHVGVLEKNEDDDQDMDEAGGNDKTGANGDGNDDDDDDDDDDAEGEDVDEDDGPVTRRTRRSRAAPAVSEPPAEPEEEPTGRPRRLTRRAGLKKSAKEPSSDFDPGDDSEDHDASEAEKQPAEVDSPTPRGRGRGRGRSTRRRGDDSADEDPEFDPDELNEEARELRQASRPRRRRAREESPIVYEARRSRARVNYYMPPLTSAIAEEEEAEEPAPTPARARRGRGAASTLWERSLNTTFGPFGGGGGAGALLSGPWGTGAAGGVDSDSSDDEMVHRSNVAGNVGMTPTSGAAPSGLVTAGQGMAAEAAPNVGKIKDRKALADADPLGVDMNVDFDKVGGLQGHIDQLKEMVQLPLLYPELFSKFHVTPPRGVLFHGPPGTGKTLLARALANSVGAGGRKISFYMRKGADALSKWVGEAEKQLRLLFEEARRTQPSIIFFDEIDGLAPVRSSKQEQIHASIVSTLLALMDGMDGRGQVIVIGATNRPDNIDPALRRPGRFDREFYFPLPDIDGRRAIIDIHTKDWGLSQQFRHSLATQTKGYGGADLRALSTEAALNAIQRTYPQIYSTQEKLVVRPENITVHASDFMMAIKRLIPSSERSATSGAQPLPPTVEPLLCDQFETARAAIDELLPRKKKLTALEEAMYEQFDDDDHGFGREALHQEFERCRVFRPRFIIYGDHGMGQGYLSSAILHHLEGVHVQNFDLPSLLGDGRPMEQVIVSLFTEVRRHKPAVIFIPNIEAWYATLQGSIALVTFQTMLRSIPPTDPIIVLATAECERNEAPTDLLREFFGFSRKNRMEIPRPTTANRRKYFSATLDYIKKKPWEFPDPSNRKKRILEQLPVAPKEEPKPPTKAEIKALQKKDHQMLNTLKIQLQPIMDQINRKYKKFRQPVIPQATIDYLFAEADPNFVSPDVVDGRHRPYEIVKDKHENDVLRDTTTGKCYYNLETTTIEERLSNGFYARPQDFLFDIRALAKDAKNIGDKERTLKANELLSNVEVDVASIEAASSHMDWEGLYRRQVQRAKDLAERNRKRKAMQSVVGRVQSDVAGSGNGTGNDSDSQGPVTLGEAVPGSLTTARFQLMTAVPGHEPSSSSHALSNGTAGHDRQTPVGGSDDVQMGGVDDDIPLVVSDMGPPPKSQNQISQRSAVTSLPPGVSPSAVINEASTTKTSDPSTGSNWGPSTPSTQMTNGHNNHGSSNRGVTSTSQDDSDLPDTAVVPSQNAGVPAHSQMTASEDSWIHSQAHALHESNSNNSNNNSNSNSHNPESQSWSQSQSQAPGSAAAAAAAAASTAAAAAPKPSPRNGSIDIGNLLNDRDGDDDSSRNYDDEKKRWQRQQQQQEQEQELSRNSASSASQPLSIDSAVDSALDSLTDKTSGCTIEQLEQINRELMDEIWRGRNEWNRQMVLNHVTSVFNQAIDDIESMQGVGPLSQR